MISKKDKILKVANKLLVEEGSSNFSMRKVATEASMSLGNLQYYFKTKTDLINGILEYYINTYKEELDSYLEGCIKGREGLEEFIKSMLLESINDEDDKFYITLFSSAELKGLDIPLKQHYGELLNMLNIVLDTIIGESLAPESLNRGSALLFPYFEGYASVGTYTTIDHNSMAKVLSDMVWELVTGS
jgi:AcrR family transcriptional regulator